MDTFFLTYQSFINAQQLLEKLVERYHVPWFPNKTWTEFETIRNKTQVRICNLLLTWTKKYTSDLIIKKQHEGLEENSKQKSIQLMKQTFVNDLLIFVETILAEDHPIMSRQIRRNIIKLVSMWSLISWETWLSVFVFPTLTAREQGSNTLLECAPSCKLKK